MGRSDIQSIQDKPIMHCPQYEVGMALILNWLDIWLMLDRISDGQARYPIYPGQTNHALSTVQSRNGVDIELTGYLADARQDSSWVG